MDKNRIEEAKDLLDKIKEIEDKLQTEKVIKDNKAEFKVKYKDKDKINIVTYRVRKPTFKEQEVINEMCMIKYRELLDTVDEKGNPVYEFRKKWVERWKKRGIDIPNMEAEIDSLQNKIKDLLYKLAPLKDENEREVLRKEIRKVENIQMQLSNEITFRLHYSLEDTLTTYTTFYLTYLVLEKKEDNGWIKVFKKYEDFEKSADDSLINQALYYISLLT